MDGCRSLALVWQKNVMASGSCFQTMLCSIVQYTDQIYRFIYTLMVSMLVKLSKLKPQVSHFTAYATFFTAPACQVEPKMPKGASRSLLLQGKAKSWTNSQTWLAEGILTCKQFLKQQEQYEVTFQKMFTRKSNNLQLVVLLGNMMPTLNVISNGFFGDAMVFTWSLTLSTSHCRYL